MRVVERRARRLPGVGRRHAIAVCVVVGACLLGAVSTASASKLCVDPSGTLRFAAGASEVNRVDATDLGTGGFTVITDPGSLIHTGPVITLSTMVNPPTGPASAAYGGAGNDKIVANRGTSVGLLDGGDGNDRLSTDEFAAAATLDGGAGKDLITTKNLTGGGPFPYAAQILGGDGPDTIDGGGAGDTLDCGPAVDHYKVYLGDVVTGCEIAIP